MELVEGFVNDAGIVLVEPIAEMVIWDQHTDRVWSLEKEPRGSKPSVETMLVDLGLDLVEYFFPEVHVLYGCNEASYKYKRKKPGPPKQTLRARKISTGFSIDVENKPYGGPPSPLEKCFIVVDLGPRVI